MSKKKERKQWQEDERVLEKKESQKCNRKTKKNNKKTKTGFNHINLLKIIQAPAVEKRKEENLPPFSPACFEVAVYDIAHLFAFRRSQCFSRDTDLVVLDLNFQLL